MKKKLVFLLLLSVVFLSTSCGQSPPRTQSDGRGEFSVSDRTEPAVKSPTGQEDVSAFSDHENIGGDDFYMAHKFLYHAYSTELINHVGEDALAAWGENMADQDREESNIVSFVQYFNIPKETFIALTRSNLDADFLAEYDGVTVYSLEQIDAIYSGDKEEINRTFCGPLAFVNDADGELYSIYWLSEHDAQDYVDAQLPLAEVEALLDKVTEEEYPALTALREQAEMQLISAESLE